MLTLLSHDTKKQRLMPELTNRRGKRDNGKELKGTNKLPGRIAGGGDIKPSLGTPNSPFSQHFHIILKDLKKILLRLFLWQSRRKKRRIFFRPRSGFLARRSHSESPSLSSEMLGGREDVGYPFSSIVISGVSVLRYVGKASLDTATSFSGSLAMEFHPRNLVPC